MAIPKKNKAEEEPSPGLHLSERYPDPAVEVLIRALRNTGFSMRQSNALPAECAGLKGQSGSAAADICCGATFLTIES
jgi:hypothetical protein